MFAVAQQWRIQDFNHVGGASHTPYANVNPNAITWPMSSLSKTLHENEEICSYRGARVPCAPLRSRRYDSV